MILEEVTESGIAERNRAQLIQCWVRRKIERDLNVDRATPTEVIDIDTFVSAMMDLHELTADLMTARGEDGTYSLTEHVSSEEIEVLACKVLGVGKVDVSTVLSCSVFSAVTWRSAGVMPVKFLLRVCQEYFLAAHLNHSGQQPSNYPAPVQEFWKELQEKRISTTSGAASIAAKPARGIGRQRMNASRVIKAKQKEGIFDVFLSHNSKDKVAVEKIAKRLLSVGIRPWLDKWNLSPGDTIQDALERAIKTIPCAALCFGPADVGKWHVMEIRAYVEQWATKGNRMIPVILPGVTEVPELPLFVRQALWVDMRDSYLKESDSFYRLVCGILAMPPGDSPRKKFGARDIVNWQRIRL